MFRVGTNYQYRGEILEPGEYIYVPDHHYNEDSQSYPIQQLLENSPDPKSHTVVFYTVTEHDDGILDNYNCVFMPYFTAITEQEFNNANIVVDWSHKPYTFNFMINKPRRHREFLLQLIEYFKLDNYTYTLCWKDASGKLRPIANDRYQHLDRPVSIAPRQFLLGQEINLDRGLQYGSVTNAQNYQAFLKQQIFEPSCISLITEPPFYEREIMHTEKTVMAFWGGTIPIWVGGWRNADYLKKHNFDTFDDIVDHSYETMPDPYDRCYYAIERNLKLFQDHDKIKQFVADNQPRFQHNLDLVKAGFLGQVTRRALDQANLTKTYWKEWELNL